MNRKRPAAGWPPLSGAQICGQGRRVAATAPPVRAMGPNWPAQREPPIVVPVEPTQLGSAHSRSSPLASNFNRPNQAPVPVGRGGRPLTRVRSRVAGSVGATGGRPGGVGRAAGWPVRPSVRLSVRLRARLPARSPRPLAGRTNLLAAAPVAAVELRPQREQNRTAN